jgi:hypothetical protein
MGAERRRGARPRGLRAPPAHAPGARPRGDRSPCASSSPGKQPRIPVIGSDRRANESEMPRGDDGGWSRGKRRRVAPRCQLSERPPRRTCRFLRSGGDFRLEPSDRAAPRGSTDDLGRSHGGQLGTEQVALMKGERQPAAHQRNPVRSVVAGAGSLGGDFGRGLGSKSTDICRGRIWGTSLDAAGGSGGASEAWSASSRAIEP